MNWKTESARNKLVRNKLRLMVDQWSREVFAQGKLLLLAAQARRLLWWSALHLFRVPELRGNTECQSGTAILDASLLGTWCSRDLPESWLYSSLSLFFISFMNLTWWSSLLSFCPCYIFPGLKYYLHEGRGWFVFEFPGRHLTHCRLFTNTYQMNSV